MLLPILVSGLASLLAGAGRCESRQHVPRFEQPYHPGSEEISAEDTSGVTR